MKAINNKMVQQPTKVSCPRDLPARRERGRHGGKDCFRRWPLHHETYKVSTTFHPPDKLEYFGKLRRNAFEYSLQGWAWASSLTPCTPGLSTTVVNVVKNESRGVNILFQVWYKSRTCWNTDEDSFSKSRLHHLKLSFEIQEIYLWKHARGFTYVPFPLTRLSAEKQNESKEEETRLQILRNLQPLSGARSPVSCWRGTQDALFGRFPVTPRRFSPVAQAYLSAGQAAYVRRAFSEHVRIV